MSARVGPAMAIALAYIRENPGCCTAEVDRARRTARGGHQWMYATVHRLVRAGLVTTRRNGARADLYAVEQ